MGQQFFDSHFLEKICFGVRNFAIENGHIYTGRLLQCICTQIRDEIIDPPVIHLLLRYAVLYTCM